MELHAQEGIHSLTSNNYSMPAYGQQPSRGHLDSPDGQQFASAQSEYGVQSVGLGSC